MKSSMKYAVIAILAGSLAGAACNTPVPSIRVSLSSMRQSCPSTECMKVSLTCPTVMWIKIMDPDSPDHPFLTQCTPVSFNSTRDMCSLASVDLIDKPIPVRHLEVQMALYPASEIPIAADQSLLCPDNVNFDATGYPVEQALASQPTPALGGVGWYDPGDSVVSVNLGCTDLSAINTSCTPSDLVTVSGTVEDFSTGAVLAADSSDADQLDVFVGEPRGVDAHYELSAAAAPELPRHDTGMVATWQNSLSLALTNFACLVVLEQVAQSTSTVTCKPLQMSPIALRGAWIDKKQLAEILGALGLKDFPSAGLTIGMVVGEDGRPVAGATVAAKLMPPSSVIYLSKDHTAFVAGATSESGIFVSTTAPFGTEFSTTQGVAAPMLIGIGGNIQDRVTVVILSPNGT